MAPFSKLPAEILLLIVSEVRSNRDLAAFSRSCRSVYDLSRNQMPLRRKYRQIRLKSNSDLEKAFSLLIAILRRPQLGDLVRHLELDRPPTSYHEYEIRNKDLRNLESEDLERLRTAVENAGFTGEYGVKILNMVLQPYEFGSAYAGLVYLPFSSSDTLICPKRITRLNVFDNIQDPSRGLASCLGRTGTRRVADLSVSVHGIHEHEHSYV